MRRDAAEAEHLGDTDQKPFRKGVAFGSADLQVCEYSCVSVRDEHNINIVTK